MSASGGLTASSLVPDYSFNWVFLVELVVCGILTLFFLFYFNRLFATLVSYGVRAWTWHKYRVYIDIQALQISLLAGRIFFKGLRYHGNNETILIQSGYVTWSYWLRNVRELDICTREGGSKQAGTEPTRDGGEKDQPTAEEDAATNNRAKLPCRLSVTIKGLEWFIYNRSPAYDSIFAGLSERENPESVKVDEQETSKQYRGLKKRFPPSNLTDVKNTYSGGSSDSDKGSKLSPLTKNETYQSNVGGEFNQQSLSATDVHEGNYNGGPEGNIFLQFLPIHIECTKAAVVMGNENTKSVLITKVDKLSGEVDAAACAAPDLYRQIINLQLEHPVVQIKPNDDYKEDQAAAASYANRGTAEQAQPEQAHVHHHSFIHRQRRKASHKLRNLVPYFMSSVESVLSSNGDNNADIAGSPGNSFQWQGLSRYLDESEQDDKSRWSAIEYATVSTILDSPSASFSYYWDIPGVVTTARGHSAMEQDKIKDINGGQPPEFGIDLAIKGAMVNYGPWADRQRADLQRVFFPSLCKDSAPAKKLQPGETRVATIFKLYIQLDTETVLRIPIREESKNWKWKSQADTMGQRIDEQKNRNSKTTRKSKADKAGPGPEVRPFGWVDIKMAENATITYTMDMVAGASGFVNRLDLDLPKTEIMTSVNHGLLWRSVNQRLSCDLSNPLTWNGLRTWNFDITSNGLELFILREHIFLFIDLVDDWASGPPADYLTFTPFRYLVNLEFGHFRLYLNANDSNIINNPSDFDDNTFVVIFGTALTADLCIPLDTFRPYRNEVSFNVKAHTGGLDLHVPPWNTQATFLTSTELAKLKNLEICGKYQYCSTTSTSNTDTLLLDVSGRHLDVEIYGFLVRYLMKIKDNYFGDDIRFKTLEEYQKTLLRATKKENIDLDDTPPHKKSNDLDVILSINAKNSTVLLPANLYSATEHVRIEITEISADLRFTNYYMDLDLNISPLAFSLGREDDGVSTPSSATSSTMLFVDGIDVFGNRLFGLPPTEPTYLCNWDFSVGAVTGECSTEFVSRISSGVKSFMFSFDDDENALQSISAIILHDVTFLRASVERVRLWMHVDESAFLLSSDQIDFNFDDWAGLNYSKKLKMHLPNLVFACVDAESASRHRTRLDHPVETHAYVQTSVAMTMFDRKVRFTEDKTLQQRHLFREDSRTHRTEFLLHAELMDTIRDVIPETSDPPAMCIPTVPPPITRSNIDLTDDTSSLSTKSSRSLRKSLHRKSSFLSTVSKHSDQQSESDIVRAQSRHSILAQHLQLPEDLRSRSRQSTGAPSRPGQLRDVSASTGRHSSFYSAMGDHPDRRGLPPASVAFSSSFIAPYFPLDSVEPDTKDVPHATIEEGGADISDIDANNLQSQNFSEEAEYTSFIIELKQGLRAYCNPVALKSVARLLTVLQAVGPVDIMDEIQINSMSNIFAAQKQDAVAGKTTDVRVLIPVIQIRFTNSSPFDTYASSQQEVDQYDFSLSGLSVTSRTALAVKDPEAAEQVREASALHLRLKSAGISAKERLDDFDDPQAAIHGCIEDVTFWLASKDSLSGNIDISSIEVSTNSSKVEYLASLLHRTTLLGADLEETFKSSQFQQKNRVQLFTFLVTISGQQTTDPLFLTRPSYVLRSATDHLRTNDSWKAITRLRHVYTSLKPEIQHKISQRCLNVSEICPDDALQQVLNAFEQWRSWDLNNLRECFMMRNVFGPLDSDTVDFHVEKPVEMAVIVRRTSLLLDPGPKLNQICLETFAANLAIAIPCDRPGDTSSNNLSPTKSTCLQIYCADVSVNLNWELCELVENNLKLYSESRPVASDRKPSPNPSRKRTPTTDHLIQVLVVTEKGSIVIDTINIRAFSISEGLKGSILFKDSQDGGMVASVMIAAEAATTKIRSNYQDLSLMQLRKPSIYVSKQPPTKNASETTWKAAANCKELSLIIGQDPLALLEVVDLLLGDEVAQVHQLFQKLPSSNYSQSSKSENSEAEVFNKIDVALFLDMYHISVPLLHSLRYDISGVVARASVAVMHDSDLVFDFDIKEHSHDIQTQINDNPRSISLLQMPPTNGRVTSHMGIDENMVSVFASVEPVQLDAAAIHSLLAALNRPEISSVIGEVKESVKQVQNHIEDIFGPQQRPSLNSNSEIRKSLIYNAHLTFAGFDIFANAPGSEEGHDTARVSLNLGCVLIEANNRLGQSGPVLPFPEIRLGLRHVMFELSRVTHKGLEPCGNFAFDAYMTASSRRSTNGDEIRSYHVKSDGLDINLFADTASTVVDVLGHLQNRIKDLDLSREVQYLQNLRKTNPLITVHNEDMEQSEGMSGSAMLFTSTYSLELLDVRISWIVDSLVHDRTQKEKENLVLSFKRIDLSTRKDNSARLTMEDLQLQMAPASLDKQLRSQNSALLPEVIFNVAYVSTTDTRKLAFQAAGKSVDLRLTSQFIIPAADLKTSIESAARKVRTASESWSLSTTSPEQPSNIKRQPFFGKKRMESLLVDADFAGAVVHLQGKKVFDKSKPTPRADRAVHDGRYGQFSQDDPSSSTMLRAPGLAWKVEYKDNGLDDPSLNAEVKVDASSNILYPTVVPLIMEISETVKALVSNKDDSKSQEAKISTQKFMSADEDNILTADPSTVLGRTRLNLGLRICTQEFSLSCQPIARVAATARFDDIYFTVNTVRSVEHGHFFAISAAFTRLQASVQHVYSRESTGSFDVDSVVLSLMNSKHVSGTSGVSAILKISPMKILINAKQLQDFLLFREIWVPPEIRQTAQAPTTNVPTQQPHTILVQRYQQVAATGAFPWNATVSIAELDVQLDMGQAIGKSAFKISNFWVSSKKNSDWEQNLCFGFDRVGVDSTGRMSGFITLQDFKVRTSIQWPQREKALNQTPLVQGSLDFSQLRVKVAFDYQAFLVADITTFNFLMYNVRNRANAKGDRLVAILDGESVQAFCTTTTASQGLALYQAFLRLVQEKRTNYETSLKEIERFMKRKSIAQPASLPSPTILASQDKTSKSPISLHTDVVVTLKAVNVGAFPSTFFDHQVFKLEALNAQARFAVTMNDGRIHSALGLTLGQLRIGLASVKPTTVPKSSGEISVDEVVNNATGSRGGTILKVPKVEATMETWQSPSSNQIDYIFKSSFEGKVEVGWNYSRISYIRGMYANHSKALALRLGKPLPPSAVRITGVPGEQDDEGKKREQQKITTEVTVPQSKYEYFALEPPIIETPQLRDMGEATPPLEWIGLHRDRLPNLTHQIVIVSLLELASEVEDAYSKILGSS